MKHSFFFLFLLLGAWLTAPLSSQGFDAGLTLDTQNNLIVESPDLSPASSFNHTATALLWYQNSFRPWAFTVQLAGKESLAWDDLSSGGPGPVALVPELRTLNLLGVFPVDTTVVKQTQFQIGRFSFSDPTRLVLSHTLDGLNLTVQADNFEVGVGAGTTALLLHGESGLTWDADDLQGAEAWYTLAPPKAVAQIRARVNLLPGLEFQFAFLPVFDLKAIFDGVGEDGFLKDGSPAVTGEDAKQFESHTQHLALRLGGLIADQFLYDLNYAYLTGGTLVFSSTEDVYQARNYGAGAASFNLSWVPALTWSPILRLRGLWAQGDTNSRQGFNELATFEAVPATVNLYRPISPLNLGFAYSPAFGNVSVAEMQFSFRPGATGPRTLDGPLQVNLRGTAFFRNETGPTSLSSSGEPGYLGTEAGLALNWRPLSDFGLSLNSAFFFPPEGSEDKKILKIGLYSSLSF